MNITFVLTHNCNLKCSYCYDKNAIKSSISLERAVVCLDKIAKFAGSNIGSWVVSYFGGEPLSLGKRYINILTQYGKSLGLFQKIQTNGTLLDEDYIRILKDNDVYLAISYDGPGTNSVNRVCKNGAQSAKIVEGVISKLNDVDYEKYGITCTLSNANHGKVMEIYNHLLDMEVKDITFNRVLCKSSCLSPKEEAIDVRDLLKATYNRPHIGYEVSPIGKLLSMLMFERNIECSSCQEGHFAITPEENIVPCGVLSTHRLCPVYGNLKNSGLKNILNHPLRMKFINDAKNVPKGCVECEYKSYCTHGCMTFGAVLHGDLFKERPQCHKHIFESVSSTIKEICENEK